MSTPTSSARPLAEAFERELSATAAQFERDLRVAWPGGVSSPVPGHFVLSDGETRLDILIESRGLRRLGLFELPQLAARYHFTGGDDHARRRLLERLDRAMQRGGG